jgi:hypothetical protein
MRVHTYVIATDAGSAPNYDPPLTTLAVCKPRIRRKATVGELVLAFAGATMNPYEPHTVVWAGVVAEKLTFDEYWNDPRFEAKKPDCNARPDNFYRPMDGGLLQVANRVHGPEHFNRDTGGTYVLAFNPSWRFGANGPRLPSEFGLRMAQARRGERLHDLTDAEWHDLQAWLNDQSTLDALPRQGERHCRPSPSRNAQSTPRKPRC